MSTARRDGFVGVLLAAGRSRRMGVTKQLLPWPIGGSGTVVEAAFDVIATLCLRMVVVLGHDADRVRTALGERSFHEVLVDPDAEMIESIRAGLRIVATLVAVRAVVLHPADHPAVLPKTVAGLIDAFESSGAYAAVMPEVAGTGGHPAVIPATMVRSIIEFAGEGGLREFWRSNASACHRITSTDTGTVWDLDRPDDYKSSV